MIMTPSFRTVGLGTHRQVGGPVVVRHDGMYEHHRAGDQHGYESDMSAQFHRFPKVKTFKI